MAVADDALPCLARAGVAVYAVDHDHAGAVYAWQQAEQSIHMLHIGAYHHTLAVDDSGHLVALSHREDAGTARAGREILLALSAQAVYEVEDIAGLNLVGHAQAETQQAQRHTALHGNPLLQVGVGIIGVMLVDDIVYL